MRFSIRPLDNIRSLGDKLILITALTLLSCLLLLTLASLELFTLYSQHVARTNTNQQMVLMKKQYQAANQSLLQEADLLAADTRITSLASQSSTLSPPEQQNTLAMLLLAHPNLGGLWIVDKNHAPLASLDTGASTKQAQDPYLSAMVSQALQGHSALALRQVTAATIPSPGAQWALEVAVPIGPPNAITGVLILTRHLDDGFAQSLIQGTPGEDDLLCMNQHPFTGTAIASAVRDYTPAQIASLCTPGTTSSLSLNMAQQYMTFAQSARTTNQLAGSPSLVLVAIQPVEFSHQARWNALLVLVGIGIFIFGLSITLYAFITHRLFIRPIRKLDKDVRALVVSHGQEQAAPPAVPALDELSTLSRSFSLLSESLDNENQAIIEQMSHILVLSDALISTLHFEPLLGEIVSQLGKIMQVKNATLLLYGFDRPAPWAVAQWTRQPTQSTDILARLVTPAELGAVPQGAVTVHADPTGDITMAPTSKMIALTPSSGKNKAIHPPKNGKGANGSSQQTGPRSRIPQPSLRDLDMILARMVMQRKRIAFGENISSIAAERHENWAHLALDAGYLSVIAVPLLLQNRAIGAFMLYDDKPYQVNRQDTDTFLLSSASIQASMAVQNALLFAEAKEKNAALERANHLKSQFLANVTHELRTPLHSIISYGGFMLEGFGDGGLTKEQEGHIQFMVRSAEDLSDLVNDMLDLSKIEADHIEVNVEPLSVSQSLGDVVNRLKPLADNKQLALELDIEEDLPLVLADSRRLRQVLINLVSNALKFTEQGNVTISSTYLRRDDTVRIAVRDTGIGISPAALEYIFEAFRQADGSTTRRFGGTGLGLTIAKKLIELQGGEVAVESVVGEGSTFSFVLPVATYAHEPLLQRRS